MAPNTTDVAKPAKNEFVPSSRTLICSIMHSYRTKKNPKLANPLAVPNILLKSLLKTIAVDLLIFPSYIYLIYTAFINIAITNPKAPPAAYENIAFPKQFYYKGLTISDDLLN